MSTALRSPTRVLNSGEKAIDTVRGSIWLRFLMAPKILLSSFHFILLGLG